MDKKNRLLISVLNFSGLGIGYLLIKQYKRWGFYFLGLIFLILIGTLTHASRLPVLWIFIFLLYNTWMAYDVWKISEKQSVHLSEKLVQHKIILPILVVVIFLLEIAGFFLMRSTARSLYQAGISAMQSADYSGANRQFQKIATIYQLTMDPVVSKAEDMLKQTDILLLAVNQYQTSDFEKSISTYENFLQLYPQSEQREDIKNRIASIYREWGMSLQEQKEYEQALQKYSAARQKYDDTLVVKDHFYTEMANLNLQLARQQAENKDYVSALKTYIWLINVYSDTTSRQQAVIEIPEVYLKYAQSEFSMGNYENSISIIQKLIVDYPSSPASKQGKDLLSHVILKRASLWRNENRFLDALRDLDWVKNNTKDQGLITEAEKEEETTLSFLSRSTGKDASEIIQYALNNACGINKQENEFIAALLTKVVGIYTDESPKVKACASFYIPVEKIATIPGTFRYVVKRETGQDRVQSCSYTGGHRLDRIRNTATFSLVDVVSGKIFAKTKLVGSNPPACPHFRVFYRQTEQSIGSGITDEQIATWLEKVLR